MKRILFCLIILITFSALKAQPGIWGSAVYITVNGNAQFYNTKQSDAPYAIGNVPLHGSLGVFGKNSGNLKINGAEVNIAFPGTTCNVKLFYCVYKSGERPAGPSFNVINLEQYCRCNGNSFSGCGGKACNGADDRKFQSVNDAVDLTRFETGDYTLEIYYEANGGSNCSQQFVDNNDGNNYTATFTITTPLSLNITFLNGQARDEDILIKWVVQDDQDMRNYEIEKSVSGLNFTAIQTVNSQQSSSSTYLINDIHPVIGTNYYRIKSYNINGTVNLSRVFRIYYGKVGNTVLIYPNPVEKQLNIRLAGVKKGIYKMSVIGTSGHIITSQNLLHDGIDKTIQVNLPPEINRGVYRLFLIDKYQFYKQTFMVK